MSGPKKKKETPVSSLPATQTPTIDDHTLAAARTRIDVAAVVLTGFHLRHKNQHRVSTYWWPALGQLRRHVRRLGNELAMADKAAKRTTPKGGAARDDRHPAALVLARARWIREHFVPKAYIAFSRLVADRQFAPLGLLLMGVLAQVNAVLRSLDAAAVGSAPVAELGARAKEGKAPPRTAGRDDSADGESGEDKDDDDDNDCASLRPAPRLGKDAGSFEPAADVGVAVPREEEDAGKEGSDGGRIQTPGGADNTAPSAVRQSGREAGEAGKPGRRLSLTPTAMLSAKKRRKAERPSEDADLVAETAAGTANGMLSEKSDKKEKKEKKAKAKAKAKKRKRDEFDDLFNGLM